MWRFSLVMLLLAAATTACAADPAQCREDLQPIEVAPPKLPALLHNEFSGTVEVSLHVHSSGRVSDPTVLSTALEPVGRTSGHPRGYEQAVLQAVLSWRFPEQPHPCVKHVTVNVEHVAPGA